jgi:hypothetical protein
VVANDNHNGQVSNDYIKIIKKQNKNETPATLTYIDQQAKIFFKLNEILQKN